MGGGHAKSSLASSEGRWGSWHHSDPGVTVTGGGHRSPSLNSPCMAPHPSPSPRGPRLLPRVPVLARGVGGATAGWQGVGGTGGLSPLTPPCFMHLPMLRGATPGDPSGKDSPGPKQATNTQTPRRAKIKPGAAPPPPPALLPVPHPLHPTEMRTVPRCGLTMFLCPALSPQGPH